LFARWTLNRLPRVGQAKRLAFRKFTNQTFATRVAGQRRPDFEPRAAAVSSRVLISGSRRPPPQETDSYLELNSTPQTLGTRAHWIDGELLERDPQVACSRMPASKIPRTNRRREVTQARGSPGTRRWSHWWTATRRFTGLVDRFALLAQLAAEKPGRVANTPRATGRSRNNERGRLSVLSGAPSTLPAETSREESLQAKVALVTGGSSGLGAATAVKFAARRGERW
jgi:hypothetical protein